MPPGSSRSDAPRTPEGRATVTLASVDGLAYALVPSTSPARGGVVILHGAGSCKENHLDFAHLCAAAGLDAVAFDQRGHGASEGALGAGALEDVATIAGLLGPGPLFLRGSSMGGFVALAAAQRVRARAVVAICPASGAQLAAGVRAGRLGFGADIPALEQLLAAVDLDAAARALGPASCSCTPKPTTASRSSTRPRCTHRRPAAASSACPAATTAPCSTTRSCRRRRCGSCSRAVLSNRRPYRGCRVNRLVLSGAWMTLV